MIAEKTRKIRVFMKEVLNRGSVLQEHAEGHAQLTEVLLDNEVIYTEDVEKIFGKRQWKSRSEEILRDNEAMKKNGDNSEVIAEEEPTDETLKDELIGAEIEEAEQKKKSRKIEFPN